MAVPYNHRAIEQKWRVSVFAHQRQLFQFGDGVASVGYHLTDKDIVIGIEPFLDNGEYVFTVDGQASCLIAHALFTPFMFLNQLFFFYISYINTLHIKSQEKISTR